MSLGEAQALYNALEEIEVLINNIEQQTLRMEGAHVLGNMREVEYILFRVTSLMGRLGLPKQVDAAINKLQHLILVARMLHSTLRYLESGTTFGLIVGILTFAGSLVAASSMGNNTISYDMRGL
jgi:hypothetical protein